MRGETSSRNKSSHSPPKLLREKLLQCLRTYTDTCSVTVSGRCRSRRGKEKKERKIKRMKWGKKNKAQQNIMDKETTQLKESRKKMKAPGRAPTPKKLSLPEASTN